MDMVRMVDPRPIADYRDYAWNLAHSLERLNRTALAVPGNCTFSCQVLSNYDSLGRKLTTLLL